MCRGQKWFIFLITFLSLHTPITSNLTVSFKSKQHFDHNIAPKVRLEVEPNMVTKDEDCELVFRPLYAYLIFDKQLAKLIISYESFLCFTFYFFHWENSENSHQNT